MKKESSVVLEFLKGIPFGKVLLIFLLVYILCLIIPYIAHKDVPETFKQQFHPDQCYSNTQGSERVAYINDNDDALLYRLHMIENAKEEVILSTFDFQSDEPGKDVMAALIDASKRGVSVRVIVDGTSGLLDMTGNEYFKALASYPNISIKVYNTINFFRPYDMQARLHDKYVIVDRQMYLLGGRNTDHRFLGSYTKAQNIDRELFVYNTATPDSDASVSQLLTYFENVWALKDSKDYICKKESKKVLAAQTELEERMAYLKETFPSAYEDWNYVDLTLATNKVTLLSNPIESENKEPLLWYSLQKMMEESNQVTIYTPYIICGKKLFYGVLRVVILPFRRFL